jgi:hypothetical protein
MIFFVRRMRFWPIADMVYRTAHVRFLTQSGHAPAARAYAHNVFLLSDRETNCSFVPDGPAAWWRRGDGVRVLARTA